MRESFIDIAILLPRVLPQVADCPRTMVMDALQAASTDFCTESGAWAVVFTEYVYAGENSIPLSSLRETRLAGIYALYIDGSKQDHSSFMVTPYDILLKFIPQRDTSATIDGYLRPLRTVEKLPEFLIEEWGDAIADGALAKLKSMSGANIAWTDSNGATLHYNLYLESCNRAKAQIFRKRHGYGSLYLNADR